MSETSAVESVLLELSHNMSTIVQRLDSLTETTKQQSVTTRNIAGQMQKIESRQLGFESRLDSINSVVGVRSPLNADSYVAPSLPVVSSTLGLVTAELHDQSVGGAMEVDTMGPRRSARLAQKPPMRYTAGIHGLHESNPLRGGVLTSLDPSRPLQQRVTQPLEGAHATSGTGSAVSSREVSEVHATRDTISDVGPRNVNFREKDLHEVSDVNSEVRFWDVNSREISSHETNFYEEGEVDFYDVVSRKEKFHEVSDVENELNLTDHEVI